VASHKPGSACVGETGVRTIEASCERSVWASGQRYTLQCGGVTSGADRHCSVHTGLESTELSSSES